LLDTTLSLNTAWTDAIMSRRSPRQRPAKDACYRHPWERRRNLSNSPSISLQNNNEPAAANAPDAEDAAAAAAAKFDVAAADAAADKELDVAPDSAANEEFDGPADAAIDEEFNEPAAANAPAAEDAAAAAAEKFDVAPDLISSRLHLTSLITIMN
jgi:hypothetical protein